MNADQIEIRKDFNLRAFRTKLKELYELAAYAGANWGGNTIDRGSSVTMRPAGPRMV